MVTHAFRLSLAVGAGLYCLPVACIALPLAPNPGTVLAPQGPPLQLACGTMIIYPDKKAKHAPSPQTQALLEPGEPPAPDAATKPDHPATFNWESLLGKPQDASPDDGKPTRVFMPCVAHTAAWEKRQRAEREEEKKAQRIKAQKQAKVAKMLTVDPLYKIPVLPSEPLPPDNHPH